MYTVDNVYNTLEFCSFRFTVSSIIIVIIIKKNEKIRVTLCENAAGALYIVTFVECCDIKKFFYRLQTILWKLTSFVKWLKD